MSHQSITDRLEQYFREREGRWIDGMVLAEIAGHYGWRTRCSDLRLKRGLTIENRLRRVRDAHGGRFTISEYRYVAPTPVQLTLEQAS